MFEAGLFKAPATFDAGAPSELTIDPITSSLDGIFETWTIPAESNTDGPIDPPSMTNFSFSLENSTAILAAAT